MSVPPDIFTASAVADAVKLLLTDDEFTVAARKIKAQVDAMPTADEALANLMPA